MSHVDHKPEVRIWTFNCQFRSITDQVDFLCMNLKQHGYTVSISNRPSVTGLNLLIENLNEQTFPVVEQFATRHGKRLAVVMTEHIDYIGGKIFFHGLPLSEPGQYMHPLTRRVRLLYLLLARNYVRYFIRLGDLPKLNGLESMMCGIPVLTFPYPKVFATDRAALGGNDGNYDFVFSGYVTKYRRRVLDALKRDYSVLVQEKLGSRRCRDAANASAKAVLNIPQDPDWSWVSSMRVLAAWRCGRPVINVGQELTGVLADFCTNIPASGSSREIMDSLLQSSEGALQEQLDKYKAYIESSENPAFPDAAFKIWALTELGSR